MYYKVFNRIHVFMNHLQWPRELNTLKLKKTHDANSAFLYSVTLWVFALHVLSKLLKTFS